jgi:pimeloyl-ACP methyl ester carboxylesterase
MPRGVRWRLSSRMSLALSRTTQIALGVLATVVTVAACSRSSVPVSAIRFASETDARSFVGLARCSDDGSGAVVDLDPDRPLTLLVHGCRGSIGRFRALAEIFEAHDQQTLCFGYDDRNRIERVAADLAHTVQQLERDMRSRDLTIIAHSQGGLIARRAFTEELADAPEAPFQSQVRLVTVSSPFAGILSARDCSKRWLHGISLGITMAVCRGIAGRNWREIHERAALVQSPGTLRPAVHTYLQLRTDERDTCRRRAADGSCSESDFVFSLAEQANPGTVQDRTAVREVRAGHVEIVGTESIAPTKLIAVLQEERVLAETPPERAEALAALLARLYGTSASAAPALRASEDAISSR